ncbi:ribosome maturation factor RimP [Deferribacter autotrophicus]|uniref:Ribosome maturation factor RimP n=1 Tax=Deferribacter autotrophicus TaxID=500465 RepID=A0A5A8F3M3_9BACT|nr:ribosome maturation factor RimP [Deferribacter autotrophicus]KAA0258061.1 ribosome maturation factor RimP [Deferribacter autotrophicus]
MDILSEKIKKEVISFFEKNIKDDRIELYDIVFRRERRGWVLRIFIDGDRVGLDECVSVSKLVSNWLDEVDIIPYENYNLEVSTPGANREVRSLDEFKKYIGKYCKIKMKEHDKYGRINYKGYIKDVQDNYVILFVEEENKNFEIDYDKIKKANLDVKF